MHTCAHPTAEPELFGFDPGAPGGDTTVMLIQFSGTVAEAPVIRTRSEHGRPVPVLCLELHSVGPHGNTAHVELPFAEADRKAAEAQAHALRPGQRVTASTPIQLLRLSLPHASSVAPEAD